MERIRAHIPRPVLIGAAVLLLAQVVLSLGYILWVQDVQGGRKFALDAESNLPTWWSEILLVATAFAAWGVAMCNRVLSRSWVPWVLVGVGFLLLSMEEVAAIHEDVGTAAGGSDMVSIWPVFYLPAAIAGGWVLMRAVRDLPRPLATLSLAGLATFVAVLAIELLALTEESYLTIWLEENLEMLGTGLLLVAISSALVTRAGSMFVAPPPSSRDRAADDVTAVPPAAP